MLGAICRARDSASLLRRSRSSNVFGMKIGRTERFSDSDTLQNEIFGRSVDRRRFLQYAAGMGAMVSLGASAFGQAAQDASQAAGPADARLPDGSEHVLWEQP